jgi:hypothetical protein
MKTKAEYSMGKAIGITVGRLLRCSIFTITYKLKQNNSLRRRIGWNAHRSREHLCRNSGCCGGCGKQLVTINGVTSIPENRAMQ